jgi:hypothetical protein
MKSHCTLFLTLLLTPLCSLHAADVPEQKPNILMIALDDLNAYVSILQNHPGIKTPNFDRLAKRSVNFTRAYCAAPVCNPSRVAVSTGMAPHQTGIYDQRLRLEIRACDGGGINGGAIQAPWLRHNNLAKQPDLKPVVERLSAALPTSWKPSPSKQGENQ